MQAQFLIGMTCQWNHHRLILGKVYQLNSDVQLLEKPWWPSGKRYRLRSRSSQVQFPSVPVIQIYIYLRHLIFYSETSLLVAICSINVNLQQYRSYIEYNLTLCHRGGGL